MLVNRFPIKIKTNNFDRFVSSGFSNGKYLFSNKANNDWFKNLIILL